MAENSLINTSLENGLFRITLANPGRRNALSTEMMNSILHGLDIADSDDSARVIIFAAEGPVFSSGHDLKELTSARNHPDRGRDFFAETMKLCSSMMMRITNHRLPVIAAVHGIAAAAGCQLVATCDLAIASDQSKFQTPGVNIGLFCSTPMVALSRTMQNKHAMEMLLTGDALSARDAERVGLVNYTVPLEEVDSKVESLAEKIAQKSTMTIKTGKQAYYNQAQMNLDEAYDYCSQVMVENMLKRDAEEGINAFLEKRHPVWNDE